MHKGDSSLSMSTSLLSVAFIMHKPRVARSKFCRKLDGMEVIGPYIWHRNLHCFYCFPLVNCSCYVQWIRAYLKILLLCDLDKFPLEWLKKSGFLFLQQKQEWRLAAETFAICSRFYNHCVHYKIWTHVPDGSLIGKVTRFFIRRSAQSVILKEC